MTLQELRKHLMDLPRHERAEIAYELLDSVSDDELDEDPAEVEAAWAAEIKRRIDEYDAGLVEAIPAEEVFAKARALVRKIEQDRAQLR
ncbi:MAG TPA: addiction module protein [Longimicrobium sp.]|nr:addiction module protein [Longimicrobium sp.]